MLSLSERAFGPSSSPQDNITFMTSITFLRTMQSDDVSNVLIEQIKDQLSSSNTRLRGLYMLEFALQQNPDVYFKARWTSVLFDILKEPISCESKEKVCKILSIIITILLKDPVKSADDIQRFVTTLCPFLLNTAQSDLEWHNAAFQCLCDAVKSFPSVFEVYKEDLVALVLQQTNSASSKKFEVFAECFSSLPLIQSNAYPEFYQESWTKQYLYTLNTMNFLLNNLLSAFPEEKKVDVNEDAMFVFEFEGKDDFDNRFRQVRQFINLCRCLTKMLSTKSKYPVQVPLDATFDCVKRLFDVEAIMKLDPNSMDNHIILSTLSQLQIAALTLMEPLLLNFNSVLYSFFICQILKCGLKASVLPNISKETVSQLRHVIWKLLSSWICAKGPQLSYVVAREPFFLKEILKDISIPEKSVQTTDLKSHGKSKKKTPSKVTHSDNSVNKNMFSVCKEALKTLRKIVYGGLTLVNKELSEDIFCKVVQVAHAIHPSEDFPFPYTDENCRRNLYKVLLAFTIVSKPSQVEALQHSVTVFCNAMRDPSSKVTSLCCEASAICRLSLHPKKPPPILKEPADAQNRQEMNKVQKYPEWAADDAYVENITPAEEPIESIPHAAQFHPNDTEMHSSDYPQSDAHYSEQADDKQCNGEDVLEMQNSSQCQEEGESDEDEEDEEDEEEEDEEEEEINSEVDMVVTPSHVPETAQTVDASELEELRPSGVKSSMPSNAVSSDNSKNMHLNGVHSSVPEEVPLATSEIILSENGMILSEDEELEEEEGEDDREEEEEEEEDRPSYPGEKRVPEFNEPATKKQKFEREAEVREGTQNDETLQKESSPTLEEMKADFVLSDGEEIAS